MKKKILYMICIVSCAGIIACTAKKDGETTIDESTVTTEFVIDEAVVDSIEGEIDELEKEVDEVLEDILSTD